MATVEDAKDAVALLRESIVQLCGADHLNDPATLARWLSNKTTEHFHRWVRDSDLFMVVAEEEIGLSGVGMLRRDGNLSLCYVRPGRQGLGVGRALLVALESQARIWGLEEIRLSSSVLARDTVSISTE